MKKHTFIIEQYKRIKRGLNKYVPLMILGYLTINILGLVLPLVMKRIYGDVISNESVSTLQVLILAALVASLLETILRKAKDSVARWAASVYEYKLSNIIIQSILSKTKADAGSHYIADLEKLNSVSGYCSYQANRLYQMIIDLPFVLLYLYVIYWLGGPLVWVPLIILIVYFLSMRMNATGYYTNRKEEIENSDNSLKVLTETLENIHTIKGAGLEAAHIRRYKDKLKASTTASYNSAKYENIGMLINANIGQIVLLSILLVGGYQMSNGTIDFGTITACAMLGSRATTPMMHILGSYNQRNEMKLIRNRIESILNKPSILDMSVQEFPEDIEGTIELIDMPMNAFIPRGSLTVISPREMVWYKKLLRQISGYEQIDHGKVLLDNLDISKWDVGGLKGKLEYVTLPAIILKGSVIDNITLYNESKAQNAYLAAELTGLDDLVSQMSEGYETQLDSTSSNQLTASFLQRLNLTRALVDRPRILILDCVEAGMDKETQRQYIWLLEMLKGNITMLIATDLEEICNMSTHELHDNCIVRRS